MAIHYGVALVGTYGKGAGTNVRLCRYIYGADADALAATKEPAWRDWVKQSYGDA